MISSCKILYCLIHTIESNGRKMIAERTKISICIWIESLLKPIGEGFSLDLETLTSEIHEFSDTGIECISISLGCVSDTGEIECDDSDRTCHLRRTKESISSLGKLSEIQLESTTHRADCTRLVSGVIWNF